MVLLAGFFYIIYRNSPKHAYLLLAIVAASILTGNLPPARIFFPVSLAMGVVGLFAMAILSRNVRLLTIQNWFSANGFTTVDFPLAKSFFSDYAVGTSDCWCYKNVLESDGERIPFYLAVHCHTHRSNNSTSIVFHCAFYFSDGLDIAVLEQKCKMAKERTRRTNLLKSQFGYFNIKACDIFRAANDDLVVRWRVPHTQQGYSDRFKWIQQALELKSAV